MANLSMGKCILIMASVFLTAAASYSEQPESQAMETKSRSKSKNRDGTKLAVIEIKNKSALRILVRMNATEPDR